MTNLLSWYLVSIATMNYVGPYSETSCKMAVVHLQNTMCKQADYGMVCPVPDRPNTYTTCPHFTFPEVTVK